MASALFKLSSDGGSTYEAAGTALADSEALAYASSGTYSIKAALNSTAGVDTALWTITGADDVNIASLPTVTQNSDKTCTFSVPKTGGAWLLQCKVNGGVSPTTGKADPSLTRALAIKVLNSAGQQEIAVGESTEAGTYGWTKAHNDVARAADGGGGVIDGAGLTLTGRTLDVVAADSTIQVNANSIQALPANIVTASTVATALAAAASDLSINGQVLKDLGTPVDPDDAASKDYADSAAADEANWRYASSHLTANPDFNAKILTNLATPTASGHAATRGYVDGSGSVSLGSTSVSLSASDVATGHVSLTGTLSGDTTATLPSGARSLWVTNGTSGTYTLKLAGNSSGAAYVAPGQTRCIVQDGSGVLRGEALRVVEYETSLSLSSGYTVGNHDTALFKIPAAFDVDRVEVRCTTSLSGGTATVSVGVSSAYDQIVEATAIASAGDVVGLATDEAGSDFTGAIAAHYSTAQTITIRIAVSGGTLTAGALRVMVVGRYVGE